MLIYNNKFTWWKTDSLNSFLGSVSIHALIMLNVVVCWLSTLFSYGGNEELVRWLVLWRPSLTQSANWFALTWGVMFLLVMQSLCITPRLLMKLRSIWLVRNPYYGTLETSKHRPHELLGVRIWKTVIWRGSARYYRCLRYELEFVHFQG